MPGGCPTRGTAGHSWSPSPRPGWRRTAPRIDCSRPPTPRSSKSSAGTRHGPGAPSPTCATPRSARARSALAGPPIPSAEGEELLAAGIGDAPRLARDPGIDAARVLHRQGGPAGAVLDDDAARVSVVDE